MTLRDAGGEPGTSRLDEALAASGENEAWRTLEDEMEVSRHVFSGDSLQPIREAGPGPETEGSGDRTALGDALLKGLEQVRGSPTGGLVLLTDGGQNSGTPINHAVERLRASGIPVIAVGVGEATTRDVAVESLSVSEVLLAEDPAEVVVRLRSEGMSGENG